MFFSVYWVLKTNFSCWMFDQRMFSTCAVSYTHLDVYKRQVCYHLCYLNISLLIDEPLFALQWMMMTHLNALKTIEISKHFIQCKVNIDQAVNNNCFQITLPHETYSFFAENSFTNTSLSLQTICLLLFSPKLLYTCTHISEPACLQSDVYSFKS